MSTLDPAIGDADAQPPPSTGVPVDPHALETLLWNLVARSLGLDNPPRAALEDILLNEFFSD